MKLKRIFIISICLMLFAAIGMAAPQEKMLILCGEITDAGSGTVTIRSDDGKSTVAALIGKDTYLINGRNGRAIKDGDLKKGMRATAYYSQKMTKSIPPRARAFAIISGEGARFFEVEKAELSEDGSVMRVLNTNNDLIASIDGKACKDYRNIKSGDKLLLWYNIIAMSMPGRTNAEKAMILPAK